NYSKGVLLQKVQHQEDNPEEHCKPTKFLKEKSIEYFVIIPKWERPIKMSLETSIREPDCIKSRKHQIKRPLPLFQITFPNKVENKGIWNIDNVLYCKVKIQRFQRRTGASQCFNCNLRHHTAAACHSTPRCLKCREAHSILQCNKTHPKPRRQNSKCINCNEEGHLASW
ncbi:hypothetical protein AVEN_157741-1, partial [Araneus ventricosus]